MVDDNPDLDPAAPTIEQTIDQSAIDATNFGIDGKGDFPEGSEGMPEAGTEGPAEVVTIPFNIAGALAFLRNCENSIPRVGYQLGAKIPPNGVPGRDFTAVDCSGFVREEVRRATNGSKGRVSPRIRFHRVRALMGLCVLRFCHLLPLARSATLC
jgi:hypothetical protein